MAACLAFFAAELGAAALRRRPSGRRLRPFRGRLSRAAPGAPQALDRFLPLDLPRQRSGADRGAGAGARARKASRATSVYVTSLKDEAALAPLRALIERAVLRRRAQRDRLFGAARRERGRGPRSADAPVLQVVLAGVGLEAWRASLARPRAGRSCDACRAARDRRADSHARHFLQERRRARRRDRIRRGRPPAARRPRRLRRRDWRRPGRGCGERAREKRLACVLPDYPARGGRTGYAVGLDTPASAVAIAETLRAAGYDVAADCDAPALIAALRRAARADADARRIRGRARRRAGRFPDARCTRPGASPRTIPVSSAARSGSASCASAS